LYISKSIIDSTATEPGRDEIELSLYKKMPGTLPGGDKRQQRLRVCLEYTADSARMAGEF
jgi:hypothetical protein